MMPALTMGNMYQDATLCQGLILDFIWGRVGGGGGGIYQYESTLI